MPGWMSVEKTVEQYAAVHNKATGIFSIYTSCRCFKRSPFLPELQFTEGRTSVHWRQLQWVSLPLLSFCQHFGMGRLQCLCSSQQINISFLWWLETSGLQFLLISKFSGIWGTCHLWKKWQCYHSPAKSSSGNTEIEQPCQPHKDLAPKNRRVSQPSYLFRVQFNGCCCLKQDFTPLSYCISHL